jgi:hypothetical protein
MKCLSLHMSGKYRGLVVHRLKSDELAPCHLGTGKDARLGTDVQGKLRAQAADVGIALLPKSAAARWHFGIGSSRVLSVGFLDFPCTLKYLIAEKS